MMRRAMKAAAVATVAILTGCVSGQVRKEESKVDLKPRSPRPMEMRKRVAVCDFVDKTEYGKGRLGLAAGDMLATYLVKSQQFDVFERQQMKHVLDEQKLGQSGIVDPQTAVQVGKVMGVEYVVYGVISNFGIRTESTNVILYHQKKQIAESTVDARIINVKTSRIHYADTGLGVAERGTSGSMGLGGAMSYDQTMAGDSLRAAITKMLDNMIDSME